MAFNRKISNILILPHFQTKLISYFAMLFVISVISLYSTIFWFFYSFINKAKNVGIPKGHVFYQFIDNLKYDLDVTFISFAVFNFFLLIIAGVFISHRIAGPIKKLMNYLSSSPLPEEEFRLRKNDFFQDLPKVVNDLKKRS